jgi:hypothetical protein
MLRTPFTILNIAATPNPHIVDVDNKLDCTPPTSLQVTKSIRDLKHGGFSIPNPLPQFPMNVNCAPNGPSSNLMVTAGGTPQLVPNIPVHSDCMITETVPAVPPALSVLLPLAADPRH